MKAQTLINRLNKVENLSKNSKGYQIINDLLTGNYNSMIFGNKIRPCRTSGKGRFTTNLNYTVEVKYLLDIIGVKYVSGNDSPRGGKTGNYIEIASKIN